MSQPRSVSGKLRPVVILAVLCMLLFGGILLLTPIPRKIYHALRELRSAPPREGTPPPVGPGPEIPPPDPGPSELDRHADDLDAVVRELIADIKAGEPIPRRAVDYKSIDTARLWSGIKVRTELELLEGGSAALLREDPDGYVFDFKVRLAVPQASAALENLAACNPHLPDVLPGLPAMLESARVSPLYEKFYGIKTKRLQQFITRLHAVPDRHNFYDCETILELTHPESSRKVFFVQGDMDVVSDGSDGDRMPELDEYIANSSNYQPFTSYGWPKKTAQPNPLLERWQTKLAEAEKALAEGTVRQSRIEATRAKVGTWQREIADLKGRSFLIARTDPFVVLPVWMRGAASGDDFAPDVGDYAAVIYGNRILPAIFGDTGPTWKIGEASLFIARELNPDASPYSRPVSKLHVSYLLFPGTRDSKRDAPDLERWHQRVGELLAEIGGLGEGVELHRWQDAFASPTGP